MGNMTNMTKFEAPPVFVPRPYVDWTMWGAVTPVKNQGQCGSCWSFSATGALEGAMKVAGHQLVSLSEQELLTCYAAGYWSGKYSCTGSDPYRAQQYAKSYGICSENWVPYKCGDPDSTACSSQTCQSESCTAILAADGYVYSGDIWSINWVGTGPSDLEAAVTGQPVSVVLDAAERVFQYYNSGVLTDDACGQTGDHAVLAVGYGIDKNQKYWKLKNSWGTYWGESGYIRIARGKSAGYGECGVRQRSSFPIVAPPKIVV